VNEQSTSQERGQTTAEYVAITAVALGVVIAVIWMALSNTINGAIEDIGTKITDFLASITL
jgi:Flp pilus assembly pilin Flp